MKKIFYALFVIVSGVLVWLSAHHLVPLEMTELLGFITGAACVWLTVEENIWNWPIGIANAVFFVILFLRAKLFADMGLQVIYIVLGFLGWYWWLYGGKNKTELKVGRTTLASAAVLGLITAAGTWGMTLFLQHIHDAAPFWDALTTVMSLVAQYMLTKKLFENWFVWIAADVIYIWLYIYKHLYLTSGLYVIFAAMCLAGLVQWRRSLHRNMPEPLPAVHPGVVTDV